MGHVMIIMYLLNSLQRWFYENENMFTPSLPILTRGLGYQDLSYEWRSQCWSEVEWITTKSKVTEVVSVLISRGAQEVLRYK
jgi:hypothetical protein